MGCLPPIVLAIIILAVVGSGSTGEWIFVSIFTIVSFGVYAFLKAYM